MELDGEPQRAKIQGTGMVSARCPEEIRARVRLWPAICADSPGQLSGRCRTRARAFLTEIDRISSVLLRSSHAPGGLLYGSTITLVDAGADADKQRPLAHVRSFSMSGDSHRHHMP